MPQQDQVVLRLDSADGQPLDFGKALEDKVVEYAVVFPHPFAAPPLVHLSVAGLDSKAVNATNWKPDLGFRLQATNVTPRGFTIDVRLSWYNTAFRVIVAWLALEV